MPTQRLCAFATLALLTGCPTTDDEGETGASGTENTSDGSTGAALTSSTTDDSGSSSTTDDSGSGSTSGSDSTSIDPDTGSDSGSTTGGSQGCGMPVELGIAAVGDLDIEGFHVSGGRIAAAVRGDGIALLDASDPAAVSLLGTIDPAGGPTYRAAMLGDLLVGGRRGGGAFMVDAADPANMVELWVDEDLDTEDILYGDLLYLASSAGVSVVDVAVPGTPNVLVQDLQQDGNDMNIGGSTMTMESEVLYMAGFSFTSIDVSTPDAPATLADVDDTGRPDNLVSGNGYVYVGGNDGVQIFDVADPAAPALVGTYDGERATLLALDPDNDRLFVFGSSTTTTDVPLLRIVDVTDKTNPTEIGSMYDDLDDPLWAQYEDGSLYFSTDATDPASLYILDGCPPA